MNETISIQRETFNEILEERARTQGSQMAFRFVAMDGTENCITYEQLERRARAIAAQLQEHQACGERALILYPPGLDYLCAFFGCLYAGTIAVPIYPPDPIRLNRTLPRIASVAKDSGAAFLLTNQFVAQFGDVILAQAPDLRALHWVVSDLILDGKAESWQRPPVSEKSLAFFQYTSGSTGHPKGVMLSHRNLLFNSELVARFYGTHSESHCVTWTPPYHDMGLIGGILQPLYKGYPSTLMSPLDFLKNPFFWLEQMSRFRGTISASPNFGYDLCVKKIPPEKRDKLDLSAWDLACNGAEPVRFQTQRRFAEYFSPCGFREEAFAPSYGLAEATLIVSGGPKMKLRTVLSLDKEALAIHRVKEVTSQEEARVSLVSCGSLEAYQEVVIADPQSMRRAPEGHVGEIWINGASVAQGYWNRDQETRETFTARFVDDPDSLAYLRSGDLGFIKNGELFVTGRLKDLIIIRGQNIYPQDIETTVENSHEAVRRSTVAAVAIEIEGEERLVVIAEMERRYRGPVNPLDIQRRKEPFDDADLLEEKPHPSEVVEKILENVAREHALEVAEVVLLKPGSVPKTSSGKIQRHACRADYLNGNLDILFSSAHPNGRQRRSSPVKEAAIVGDEAETRLLAAISAKLNIRDLKIDEGRSLVAYGLDSLRALELNNELESIVKREIPLGLLFESNSIRDLIGRIQALDSGDESGTAPKANLDFEARLDPEIQAGPSLPAAPSEARAVFLTGVTGFIGAYLAQEILTKSSAALYCLVRADDADAAYLRLEKNLKEFDLWQETWRERIFTVPGNLGDPRLGLSESAFDALAGKIDAVYHNGANVNFLFPYRDLQAANVFGTHEVLRLASRKKLKPVHYVSTVSIFPASGQADGKAFTEEDHLKHNSQLLNGYAESKWVAEKTLVRARERGLPVNIFRVGEVVGAHNQALFRAESDATSNFLKACIEMGAAPKINFQWYFVPIDFVVASIFHLSQKHPFSSRTYHVVNRAPISSDEAFDLLQTEGYPIQQLDYDSWLRHAGEFLRKEPGHSFSALRSFFESPGLRNLSQSEGVLRIDSRQTFQAIQDPGLSCPTPAFLLSRHVKHLRNSGFLNGRSGGAPITGKWAKDGSTPDPIFRPLHFKNLTVKNRIFRSSISGRIDNYDGSGTPARVNWEERFARGGIGAIISAHVPVHVSGRILPHYAFIDRDDRIPFWREVVDRVHRYDCKFIMQLAHSGRQQDIGGVENMGKLPWSSSDGTDTFHGLKSLAMTEFQIRQTIQYFADAARRAREAGCDGIELHAANGYLFTQFLSSAINRRKDEWGGSLENRARYVLEVVRAVRGAVGRDFHLQVKISAVDRANALMFWEKKGNTLEESVQVARWLEEAGVDAIHISTGNMFPHPRNPAGFMPQKECAKHYKAMLGEGKHTLRNYLVFRFKLIFKVFNFLWMRTVPKNVEGLNLPDARAVKQAVRIPVLCTGGFQTASVIRNAIDGNSCDAVTIARPLMANPDLPRIFSSGKDRPEKPCTFCNRCLLHVLESPLGCYDDSRFGGDLSRMMEEVMAFYRPHEDEVQEPLPQSAEQKL